MPLTDPRLLHSITKFYLNLPLNFLGIPFKFTVKLFFISFKSKCVSLSLV